MRLHSLKIKGFRQFKEATVLFDKATFLIGENNIGKSSVLKAIELFLSGNTKPNSEEDFSLGICSETQDQIFKSETIQLTGEFHNLPVEAKEWRGFKGRLESYESIEEDDSGLKLTYRKTFTKNSQSPEIEILVKKRKLKEEYSGFNRLQEFLDAGISQEIIEEIFPGVSLSKKLIKKELQNLELIDDLYEIEEEIEWVKNPGGIPANILSKLPKFILIPARDEVDEMDGNKKSAMSEILNLLYTDIRDISPNFIKIQEHLLELQKEMNTSDSESEYGKMIKQLNTVVNSVFPSAKIIAEANLSDAESILKPKFNVSLSSNVSTQVSQQGTGMIRASVFALLKFREEWMKKREQKSNTLIIGFEEPEIYLHPNAATQMRDTIYELADSNIQIICTTHSPHMIDLSKKSNQILNRLVKTRSEVSAHAFNVTSEYLRLIDDEKFHIKMIIRMDDYVSRVFFAKKILIVEGDTEDIVLKETINYLPDNFKKQEIKNDFQIVKARGKASIISFAKYLRTLGLDITVIHDRDLGIAGAEKFNPHIVNSVADESKIIQLEENIEDVLGYKAPSSDKPFTAYQKTQEWKSWDDIPLKWKEVVENIFKDYRN